MKKRIGTEAAEPYDPLTWDPLLRPDWRVLDARRLANGEGAEWSSTDSAVVECKKYLKAVSNARTARQRTAIDRRWPGLGAACAITDQDGPQKWELEARLLAGQSDAEIGTRCGLSGDVIRWYETVCFNIRPRLGASMWVTSQIVGIGLWHGFQNHEAAPLWAVYGYHGGGVIIDAFVDAFRTVWQPGTPPTLSLYLTGAGVAPRVQAAVAALVLPPYGAAGDAWTAARLCHYEATVTEDGDRRALLLERAQGYIVRCARAYLAGDPLPRLRGRPTSQKDRCRGESGAPGAGTMRLSPATALLDFIANTVGSDPGWGGVTTAILDRRGVFDRDTTFEASIFQST